MFEEFLGFLTRATVAGVATGYGGAGLQVAGDILDRVERGIPVLQNLMRDATLPSFGQSITPFGQVQYWDYLNKSIKDANQGLGIAGSYSKIIEENTMDAYKSIVEYGGEIEDITKSYEELSKAYGRVLALSTSDLTELAKVRVLFGEGYTEIFELQREVGKGVGDTADFIESTMKSAMEIGVISRNAMDNLKNNLKLIDSYSFKRGTKALSEMAVYAERTKISMESAAKVSDVFRSFDSSLEAIAKLQMLGGDFANQFGDFFQLSYEARNNPEEIQKKLFAITRSLATIDKATGEITIDPYSFDLARTAAEALNVDVQELIKASRVAAKESAIKDMFSLDMKSKKDFESISQMVAGMSEFKGGQWQVNIGSEVKTISQIDEGDLEKLKTYSSSQEDLMRNVIETNRTVSESLQILIRTLQVNLVPTQFYDYVDEHTKKVLQNADNQIMQSAIFEKIKMGLSVASGAAADSFDNFGEELKKFGNAPSWDQFLKTATRNLDPNEQSKIMGLNLQSQFQQFSNPLGNTSVGNLMKLEDKANLFFDKGIGFFDMMTPKTSQIVKNLGGGSAVSPEQLKYRQSGESAPMWERAFGLDQNRIEKETKEYIGKFGIKGGDTNNDGTIDFGEFTGKILLEIAGGTQLSEADAKTLFEKIKPLIAEQISKQSKIELHKELKSNTMMSGGGRTRDAQN